MSELCASRVGGFLGVATAETMDCLGAPVRTGAV